MEESRFYFIYCNPFYKDFCWAQQDNHTVMFYVLINETNGMAKLAIPTDQEFPCASSDVVKLTTGRPYIGGHAFMGLLCITSV